MTSEERAFGRGGLGAVLGAKNVKAITFDGDSTREVEIPPLQMEIHGEAAQAEHPMKAQGTTSVAEYANMVEALPSYYFSNSPSRGSTGSAATASKRRSTRRAPARRVRSRANCRRETRSPASRPRARSTRR